MEEGLKIDPYGVGKRIRLSDKKRLKLFLERNGVCCLCHERIEVGQKWIVEHIQPLWLNGTNDWENLAPSHENCAKSKTQREAKERAKGRRIAEKHYGARQPRSVMPGSRASPWKRKIGGGVERRK